MPATATQKSTRRPSRAPAKDHGAASDDSGKAANTDTDVVSDEDATQGEWLFKQDELVLGPVSAQILVDRIKKGELSGDTPIARDGEAFRPMKLVRLFRDAWEVMLEEKRLADEEKAYQSAVRKASMGRFFIVAFSAVLPAVVAFVAAQKIMELRPWDDTPFWVARVPPLVDLPQRPPPKLAEVKKKDPVAVASNSEEDDEEEDDPKKPADPSKPKKPKKPKTGAAVASGGDDKKGDDKANTSATPASVESLSNAQAVAPLKEIQGQLKSCFKTEMDSNPDMPAQVVLSYTVTEEGKAININLDARELRGRPVVACVQKAVSTLKWPRFSGERKNVSVPFKLGKPKAPGAAP